MSLHKLTAGDGYTYLTRQVAAHDATSRGFASLGDYYEQKGESPGQWLGRGLSGLPGFSPAGGVSEPQMRALWGEGRHPDADRIEARMRAAGHTDREIQAATRLGSRYPVHAGSTRFRTEVAAAFAGYNEAVGLPRDWPVPAPVRARIRTRVADGMFVEEYGRAPADDRERAGFLARVSRQATTAVAGYDLTFSPVKSVSALWAVAPREVAEQVEAAHHAAVADAVAWLEDSATYTRVGAQGVAQVDVTGLLAAAFTHRDSRAGDPDLHTHVAISNKVQTLDSGQGDGRGDGRGGRWLALDGRPIHASAVAASERYNTRVEAELVARLGVRFTERPGTGPGRRPVRELVGADPALLTAWSRRRRAIDARRTELAAVFQVEHGRPPSPVEALHLAQQATLETRGRKHEPRSHADQRATWQTEAAAVLGGPDAVAGMVRSVLAAGGEAPGRAWADRTPAEREEWVARTAGEAVATVQTARATWRQTHVRAEAERLARRDGVPLGDLDAMVDAVVARALSSEHSLPLHAPERGPSDRSASGPLPGVIVEPAALRRRDGASVFEVAGTRRFTSTAIVAAERSLVAAAGRRDGRAAAGDVVEVALLESEANGFRLNPGQVHLIRQMATSGARLQVGLAPAGTGKTTAMRALSRAWTDSGGHVLGLAPSAAAAAVLREELSLDTFSVHTDTLAKLQHTLATQTSDARRQQRGLPGWIAAIGPDSLVVIDEAGMAGTCDLAAVVEFVLARGGSVRLIGDDQQLAAIGAGGVLRDIAATHGAVTLSHVVRFTDPAEGAASLALRAGDPAAIAYYTDQGRIHVGDLGTCVDQAYTAWSADRAAGRDALMLASTRDLVAELNARARTDRLSRNQTAGDLREVELTDGCRVSAGDTVITRENDRQLRFTSTDWVKNGDRWTVTASTPGGGLRVQHLATGRHIVLPAAYVAAHVALGYASTVHAAQGVTADVTHVIASGTESRQTMYVAMTRGRAANHLYLGVAGDGDPHTVISRDTLLPPTAVDVLARILARDGAQTSATSHTRALADPAARLQAAADRYAHALATAAQTRLGPQRLADLEVAAEQVLPGLTEHEAWPTLRAHLAMHALDGRDPSDLLSTLHNTLNTVAARRELDSAHDPAAVLDWRLDPTHLRTATPGPLPWLPGIPAALAALAANSNSTGADTEQNWGKYLAARADLVRALAADVATTASGWTPATAPAWALHLLDRNLDRNHDRDVDQGAGRPLASDLITDLAVWRAATGVPDTDPRPTGSTQIPAARARHQKRLADRATTALGDPRANAARWRHLAERLEPRLLADPGWPDLADRLTVAAHAGIDIAALTTAVAAHHPLPDEQPAAALWWRLTRHLPPALTRTADSSGNHGNGSAALRPDWAPALTALLGADAAARVQSDRVWPGLVAAVTAAVDHGWQPDAVLVTAWELLQAGTTFDGDPHDGDPHGSGHDLRDDELTQALTWRVALLATGHPGPTPVRDPLDADAPLDPDDAPPPPDPFEIPPVLDDTPPTDDASAPTSPRVDTEMVNTTWVTDDADGATDTANAAEPGDWCADVDAQTRAELEAIASRPVADYARAPLPDGQVLDPGSSQTDPTVVPSEPIYQRIHELNQLAHDFFTASYPTSWAARHLQERLGSDLADDSRFSPGYAPAGWRSLVTVLRRAGVSDAEIVAAGLGTVASTGQVIDRFRDRLVLPIRDEQGIAGFVARRNPIHDSTHDGALGSTHDGGGGNGGGVDRHGPKYLNTADTPVYRKGDHLYGLADAAAALAAGAVPVLVEGPIDAIAVTLAGGGRHFGVAALGTALTDTQANLLTSHLTSHVTSHLAPHPRSHLPGQASGVIVATDPDPAGRKAAARAYWLLAARRATPAHLQLPDGLDPAALYTREPSQLRRHLEQPTDLAAALVEDVLAAWAPRLADPDDVAGRVGAARDAIAVLAALPPLAVLEPATRLAHTLDLMPSTVYADLADAVHAWTTNPHAEARRRLQTPLPTATTAALRPPVRRSDGPDWAALAAHRPGLVDDTDWPRLVAALDRAHASTGGVPELFARLAAGDLPDGRPAWYLRHSFIGAMPAAAGPRPVTARGPGEPQGTLPAPPDPPKAPAPAAGRLPSARR
ncbi:MobF family relaxase [Kineosporia sp. A_224]|uniref:MobF family relaxase n=1 Tax=Kineosporia sp. A_224 TaxID=1962180 RepID=UPI0018E96A57|nr:MobF family relaxase [Kineosporia sp. A_224]